MDIPDEKIAKKKINYVYVLGVALCLLVMFMAWTVMSLETRYNNLVEDYNDLIEGDCCPCPHTEQPIFTEGIDVSLEELRAAPKGGVEAA